jgi:ribosomal-protein-alanine N-acetyltransferase
MLSFEIMKKNDKFLICNFVAIYANAMKNSGVRIWNESDFYELIKKDFYIFYIKCEHKIIGFVIIKILNTEAEIINISIDTIHQNRGAGKKLLNHAFHSYELSEVRRYVLEVASTNEIAKNFYKSIGFKKISTRKQYYKIEYGVHSGKKIDADIMEYLSI